MPTFRLDLEYDGTRFSGWQIQANARTVAGELTRAVEASGARVVQLGAAGRTDAGVHALCQTAHLRLDTSLDPRRLQLAINDGLPAGIHVLGVWRAADGFHARHDAAARSYLYQIARRRSGLAKRFVWWIKRPLDIGSMRLAAEGLLGPHDFSRLCEAPSKQSSTRVVVERVELVDCDDLILLRLVASHFLWKMVRRTVGALVRLGAGELDTEGWRALVDPPTAAEAGPSPAAAWTAPPSGLFLERVLYPGEPPLDPPRPVVPLGRVAERPFLGGPPKAPRGGRGDRRDARRAPPRRRRGP